MGRFFYVNIFYTFIENPNYMKPTKAIFALSTAVKPFFILRTVLMFMLLNTNTSYL